METFVVVSGDPDTKIDVQSEDDIAEQGMTPAVTEVAVRITDQGIPHTAPSGAKTTFTFRSVLFAACYAVSPLCASLTGSAKFLS